MPAGRHIFNVTVDDVHKNRSLQFSSNIQCRTECLFCTSKRVPFIKMLHTLNSNCIQSLHHHADII